MKRLSPLLVAVMFFGCQENNEMAPSSSVSDQEKETQKENKHNPGDQKLSEPVEVSYQLLAQGTPIADAEYHVDGKSYSACGDHELQFAFETDRTQSLDLNATIKNQPGNQIEAKILINGQPVAQEILKGKKGGSVYTQVNISHSLNQGFRDKQ